ncbi:MAG TPA: hypothetical protein VG435_09720 [Acidimicrobiales bacterium]|nr:hypothetical protein [Acidimicrobiales bacterium]
MTTPDPAAGGADQWANAVDTYRDVAKWLIAAFGAIGAVIAGTAPLTGIGDVSSKRVGWLAAGGAASLVGITLVLTATMAILVPETVYSHELAARPARRWERALVGMRRFDHMVATHPEDFFPPHIHSFAELAAAISNLQTLYSAQAVKVAQMDAGDAGLVQAQRALTNMQTQLQSLQGLQADLRMVARFEKARTRFHQAILACLGGGLVTAAGIAMVLYGIASKAGK